MAQAKFVVVATSAVTFFISICVMLASVSSASAENTRDPYEHKSYLALPNQKCKIPPLPKWTKPEKWVWKKICEGKVADFNKRDARPFDPRKQKDSENFSDRTLRSGFLERILLHEPFRSAIPSQGVRIIGACFPDPIDLSDASIDRPLILRLSLFRSKVGMRRLRTSSFIALSGSTFYGKLDMESVTVEGSLFMRDGAEFNQAVVLRGAKVGGYIDMVGSTFKGTLYMHSVTVGGSIDMEYGAKFNHQVVLVGAKIGNALNMSGSTFNSLLDMESVTVGGSIDMDFMSFVGVGSILGMESVTVGGSLYMYFMHFAAVGGTLNMNSVTVDGSLYMVGSKFNGELWMNSVTVGGSLWMGGSKFNGTLDMRSVTVGGSLYMWGRAKFEMVFLNGAKIGNALNMNDSTFNGNLHMDFVTVNGSLMMQKASFKNSARLLLRHSNVGTLTLQDNKEVWPKILRLEGFTYQGLGGMDEINHVDPLKEWLKKHKPYSPHLGGFTYQGLSLVTEGDQEGPSKHESGWFEEWLKKHKPYSPQPYRQLASVLRTSGQDDMADNILIASRNRELEKSKMLEGKWWSLFLLKIFIHYGYGMWKVLLPLGWAGALLLIGVIVLHLTKERDRHEGEIHKLSDAMFYSLDMLLPIIRLRELHYKNVDLKTWARYYFYLLKIMGYVLTFFLIAVLSGLAS